MGGASGFKKGRNSRSGATRNLRSIFGPAGTTSVGCNRNKHDWLSIWGRSPKFMLLQTGCNVSLGLNCPKKQLFLLSNHCSPQATQTSKYGIFQFENTAEALGGANGETNLQDSGDDHNDSAHVCRQSGAWPLNDFTVSALATMNHVLLPIHPNDLSTWTHPCVVQRSAPSGRALALQQSPSSLSLVKGCSNFKTHTCWCSFISGSVLYL